MSESLTAWIDSGNREQEEWIKLYLAKREQSHRLTYKIDIPFDDDWLATRLHAHTHDPSFREVLRKMRHSWRQKQYREKNGQQLSFQLPQQVVADLAAMAKGRQQSQAQTLREVISDAARVEERANQQVRKAEQEHKQALKNMKAAYHQKEGARNRLIEALLTTLADELCQRCCFEALIGPCDEKELSDDTRPVYESLLTTREKEIMKALPDLRLLRLNRLNLRERRTQRDSVS
ncbi:hypothetical protein NYA30BAC_01363 [Halomonas sp. NYA30]